MNTARGILVAAATRLGIPPSDYAQRYVSGEKWCTGCKAWHPDEEFGQDSTRRDGRATICSVGRRARDRALYGPDKRAKRRARYLRGRVAVL